MFLFHAPLNVLVAASCQPGKVEGTNHLAGYAALRKPHHKWGPMLGNGAAVDVVQLVQNVGASVQDTGKDQLLRHGLVVLEKDVLVAGHVGDWLVSHVSKYHLNILE